MNFAGIAKSVGPLIETIGHHHFRRVEECSTLIEWLDPRPGERILDIGCGDGYYDSLIASKGAEVVGVDIHEKRLAKARRNGARRDVGDAARPEGQDDAHGL